MNNPELDSILKKARLPEISEASLEMFPRQVTARLRQEPAPPRSARHIFPRLVWAFGLAAACVLFVFATVLWRGHLKMEANPAGDILASAKFAGETLAMFPNQVRSIVEDAHGLHLVLSEHDDVPASPPLYIRVCNGEHCSSFVTFSGQEIQVAGHAVEVLADPRGGIILAGDQFVWSNTGGAQGNEHWKIEAKVLAQAAM